MFSSIRRRKILRLPPIITSCISHHLILYKYRTVQVHACSCFVNRTQGDNIFRFDCFQKLSEYISCLSNRSHFNNASNSYHDSSVFKPDHNGMISQIDDTARCWEVCHGIRCNSLLFNVRGLPQSRGE